jgi:hypothetical protein
LWAESDCRAPSGGVAKGVDINGTRDTSRSPVAAPARAGRRPARLGAQAQPSETLHLNACAEATADSRW